MGSQEAFALEPEKVTLKGTRGSVLVELGRFDEGEALLREVWTTSGSEVDAGISAFYLGFAAGRHGHERQARRWLRRARGFAPFVGKWLSERIAGELAAIRQATGTGRSATVASAGTRQRPSSSTVAGP